MSSPGNTTSTSAYDREFAIITIRYKSGKSYVHDTTVGHARRKALDAIERKGVSWIKVWIPDPTGGKSAKVCIWEPKSKWTFNIVDQPTTKDH